LNKSWYSHCQQVRFCLQNLDIKIYSTLNAFAALKANGSIKVWGKRTGGGENAPVGSGYTKIYSTKRAFAARHLHLNKSWYNLCQWVRLLLHSLNYPTP
jgi:hypothetical protein